MKRKKSDNLVADIINEGLIYPLSLFGLLIVSNLHVVYPLNRVYGYLYTIASYPCAVVLSVIDRGVVALFYGQGYAQTGMYLSEQCFVGMKQMILGSLAYYCYDANLIVCSAVVGMICSAIYNIYVKKK